MRNKLPNIIAIDQDGMASYIQLITMMAMYNQKCHKKSLLRQFCELIKKIYPDEKYDKKIQQFEGDMLKEDNDFKQKVKKVIYYYAVESPIYHVLNKLLKASKDCT